MPQPRRPAPPQSAPPTSPATAGAAAGAAAAIVAMPALLAPAATAGAATGVGAAAITEAVQQLAGAFAAFMRQRSDDIWPLAVALMQRADPQISVGDARRLTGIEREYEAEYQRKALERITRDLRIAMANPDPTARRHAVEGILRRERRYQEQREEAIATRALARGEQQVLKRTSPLGAYWMVSEYVTEHTLDCLAMAGQFWPWKVLERYGPPRHHGCPCYLIALEEAKGLGLMTDDDIPDPADAMRRARALLRGLDEANDVAAWAIGRAALRFRNTLRNGLRTELSESEFTAHARRELRLAGLFDKDSDYEGMVGKAVMKLIHTMSGQGHSGFSAGLVTDLFQRLARYENLTPLTDDPAEWNHIAERMAGQPDLWQSARRPDAFSNDGGKTYKLLGDDERRTSEPAGRMNHAVEASISVDDSNSILSLDEAERKQWNKRYAKGTTRGGQFRPRRGGTPGRPTLAGVTGRGQARKVARSPIRDRERGRWIAINGHPVRVPERAWSRRVNGAKYTSPAGSTNVYRDGELVSEPGQPPRHRALAVPMKRSPGSSVTDVPADRVTDMLGALSARLNAHRDPMRRTIRERMSLGKPALHVGDGPEAIDAARAEGFTLGAVGPGRFINLHHDTGKLRVRYAKGAVVDVRWIPHKSAARSPNALRRPPDGWDEHARDALALADELGAQYGAQVRLPRVEIDPELADHAGRHEWNGTAVVGREARPDIETAAAARRAGRPLDDFEARGVYSAIWATTHESLHGVNPIPEELFDGADANLEEALTEELSHPIALARLRRRGEIDVVKWAISNPDALPVQGVYLPERGALASLLDRAGIKDEKARMHFLSELKFRVPPRERMATLADQLAFGGDFETWDSAYDHVMLAMEKPDIGEARGALPATAIAMLEEPEDSRAPESPGVPLMRDRKGEEIKVGDAVTITNVAGGIGDTGIAIATTGRLLRYVSDREADPIHREREVPQTRATKGIAMPRRARRSWDPRVEQLRQIDTGTALVAQQALNGDAEAQWELARRLGDVPADDPLASAILTASPGLEPIRAPTGPLHTHDVENFLAGAAYGAVLHHGTTSDLARAILGGDMPDRDPSHKGRMYGEGFYLTTDREAAREAPRKGQAPGAVLDVAVRLDNPLVLDGDDTSVVARIAAQAKTEQVTDLPAFVRDRLKAEGYDGVVRRWPDGSQWVAVFDPDSGRARAVIEPPVLASASPSSRGPARVPPELHGPGVGVRYERSATELTTAEGLGDHYYGGRQTGHFGTGVYFLSRDSDEAGLDLMDPEERQLAGVDLGAARLHRPASENDAFELHDTLRLVNDLAHAEGEDLTIGILTPRLYRMQDLAQALPPGADGIQDPVRAEAAIRDAVAGARRDREERLLDSDTASTRVMRALGYDGVDVRHLPELDNAVYGSVVYRPVMMDGGEATNHMLSHQDAQAWIADPPPGGWAGIVHHATTPEAAAGIEATGFDFDRSRSYGVWFADEPIERFGSGHVEAAVRLERVANDEDMARIRASLPTGLRQPQQAEAIRDALRSEGFDGYRGAYGDGRMVVAVVNPGAVRVTEPRQLMEQRGDGAVVGGRAGRWVWIRGMYRHIRVAEEHDEQADGVRFVSPADSTFVYRFDPAITGGAFSAGDKVLSRNLDNDGWRVGTVRGPAGGGMMVGVDWEDGRYGIMSATDLGQLVSKPRWNGHTDVRDPRYGGTRRAGAPEPRRRQQRRREPARPLITPEVARAREMFPAGARVRTRDRDPTTREIHGEVKDVRMGDAGNVLVEVEWSTGTTSTWSPAEIEPVPGSRQPDWRHGQRVRSSYPTGISSETVIEGTLSRHPGVAMTVTDDDGNVYVTSMERLRPVVPEQGARVRVHREDGSVFDATIDTIITGATPDKVEVIVELENGDRFGLLHAGRLDILEPPERVPDMGVLITDDVRSGLATIPRPTNTEPFEVAAGTGIWYHPDSPEIAHGFKLPDQLVIGPAFFALPAGDRDYHLHRALGFGLAAAIENDPEAWQEAQNAWTAGAFTANGRHLDRYSLHAAIATGYARLAAPPNLDRAYAERDAFPDAGRLIALAADEHGYPLALDTMEWARRRETGGIDPDPVDDPAGRFAATLPEGLDPVHAALIAGGYSRLSPSSFGPVYTKTTNERHEIIEIDHYGNVLRAVTQNATTGDDDLIRSLHGHTLRDAGGLLSAAGWRSGYGGGMGTSYTSPDLRRSVTIVGDLRYGSTTPIERVYEGPATLMSQASGLRGGAGITAESLLSKLHVGMNERLIRETLPSSRRWAIEGDDRGVVTLQAVEHANTEQATAHQVRVRFENGKVAEFGLPDAGDRGITEMRNGVVGQEYASRVGAVTAALRREFTQREERRRALATQIRTRVAAGTEPFDGTESYEDIRDALRRLGFDSGSSPRALQNGGVSVTFKNRRTRAKFIVRLGPLPEPGNRWDLTGRTVAQRTRVDPGAMVGERERTHGHLAQDERGLINDILGRSDELAERFGSESVTTAVRFTPRGGSPGSFGGNHGWDGTINLGSSVLPTLENVRAAKTAGRPLTERENADAYAAFKVMQHELNHGIRRGTLLYRHEDGTRGFEEALTEELAHAHVVDWLRDVGLGETVEWANRNPNHPNVNGTYQVYRRAFATLLDDARVPEADRYDLMVRWKHRTDSTVRMDEMAAMIASHGGLSVQDAKRRVVATLSRGQGDYMHGFRPVLTVNRASGPGPRPARTVEPPSTSPTIRTAGGDRLRVGDTFRGSGPSSPEGTITDIDAQHVNVRYEGGRERTWPLSDTDGTSQWTRTGIAVDGGVLRAGDRFATTAGVEGEILRFELEGTVRVRWGDARRDESYAIESGRPVWRRLDVSQIIDLGPRGRVTVGTEVLRPGRGNRRLPMTRGRVTEITAAGVKVDFGTRTDIFQPDALLRGEWVTVESHTRQLAATRGRRVEVRGSRGTFTGTIRGYPRDGQVLVRRDGATRGSRYDIANIRILEPTVEPSPRPGPTPGPAPAGTLRLRGGGTVGVGARMRGASTGKLCTVLAVEGSQLRFRRDDGSTGTYGPDQFKAVVITDHGDELKIGDTVRGAGVPADARITDIDWTQPASPRVQISNATWVPARPLEPTTVTPWMTVRSRRGEQVPVERGTKVILRDGTIAEARERSTLGSWPDLRTGQVQGRGVSGPRINAAFTINAADVIGIAGEQPTVPDTWGSSEREDLLRRLGDQHYRRVRTQRATAQLLGAQLGAPIADQIEQWWEVNNLPTRRVSGEQRAVIGGKAVRFPDAVSHLYGRVFESEASLTSLREDSPKAYEMLEKLAMDASLPWPNWRERVRPDPPVVTPPGNIFTEAVLRATFTGTFGRKGYRTEVTSVHTNGTSSGSVEGRIINARGTSVGSFSRRFSTDSEGSPTVYHSLMSIQRSAQGSGFAKAFNRHAESFYRAKGVKKVTVSANIDVGGYAWAATGFDFNVDPSDRLRPLTRAVKRAEKARQLIEGALRSRKITQAQYDSVIGRFLDPGLTVTEEAALEGKITHAWELAFLGDNHEIGKAALLGQHWSGVKHLVGPERSPFAG